MKAVVALSIILYGHVVCFAQEENYLRKSFRLTIDNDFLNYRGRGTDRYYTNGLQMEYSYPQKERKFFGSTLLLRPWNDSVNLAHWKITQLMFTPDDISETEILYKNRPYAGALFVTRGFTTFSHALNLSLHSEIDIGLIGPVSFAKNVQTWVHGVIRYNKPKGWDNQIKTDIVLNYNIDLDKQVINGKNFQGNLKLASRAGTLFNDLSIGFGLKAGKLYSCLHGYQDDCMIFKKNKSANSEVYFFSRGQLKFVLGNSLLQGGFIHSFKNGGNDFYHIDEEDMKRIVSVYETGVVINKLKWGFLFSQNFISPEFNMARTQLFGRLSITRRFE